MGFHGYEAFVRDLGGQDSVIVHVHVQTRRSSAITCVGTAGCEEWPYKRMLAALRRL